MNTQSLPSGLHRAATTLGTHAHYMPGFGNDFETEALPGALPQGMNSARRNATTGFMANSFPARPLPRPAIRTNGHGAIASALR